MKYKRGITGIKIAVFIAIAGMLLIPFSASAEVTFTSLTPMEHGLKLPEDVALAPDGKAYAVDGSQGLIMTYSPIGAPLGNIWISKPTSVAVDADGIIYVGTNENLSVKILDPSYNVVGSLGSGAGEFKLPRNISIDKATGNVYVVDQIDQSIKVYTSSGTFVRKINDYPNLPQDVTIMGNKIYVIDHPLITDQWGGKIRGAQVRAFDMDGNVLDGEVFGSYGDQEGQFVRPAGITSDTEGILYITDSFHGVVMCFTADGTYLGAIQNPSSPMVTPMGIALGNDRRLVVASLNTGSIHAFGLEGYVEPEGIDVSPSSLAFVAEEGQANPPEQVLTISNNGEEIMTYTASANQAWIILDTTSVTVEVGSTGTVPVGVDASGLGIGTYNGHVTITNGTGAAVNIPVNLEVTIPIAQPELGVSPGALDFTYKVGEANPSSQPVSVSLTNGGTTTWSATADVGWISIEPATGQGDMSIITVSVDPAVLEPGDYAGMVTVTALGADGSPASIAITLAVLHGGAIQVNCNIEEASFSIEGPEGVLYEGSGDTWSVSEIPDGTYTISYDQVIGYRTPPSETKELSGAETITFEGTYVNLAMSAEIVVTPGVDNNNPPTVGLFNADGTMVSSFTPFSESAASTGDSDRRNPRRTPRFEGTVTTAVGDINGDGKNDVVAALRVPNSTSVSIASYRADGTLIEGSAFSVTSESDGTKIGAADFDGDGKAEIVVGITAAGTSTSLKSRAFNLSRRSKPEDPPEEDPEVPASPQGNPAYVKVFAYNAGAIVDTGISLNACTGSVNVAAGDVDGDNNTELITAPGPGTSDNPEIRVWKVDTSGGIGNWSVNDTGVLITAFAGDYGANITVGDLNGDGVQEIIASSGPDPRGGLNIIKAFNGDGTAFGFEMTDSTVGYGLNIAAGDLDNDGIAEIIAGLGPSLYNYSILRIFKADGTMMNSFDAFVGTRYGAYVSVGDLAD